MKTYIYSCVLLVGFCLFTQNLRGQDSLRVYDVAVTKQFFPDSSHGKGQQTSPPKPMNLSVFLKVKHPTTSTQVCIQIGSQPNGTEFMNQTCSIVNHNGNLYLNTGGTDISKFWADAVSYPVVVPWNNMNSVQWLTIFLKDNQGKYSEKKYFQIQ
jgi:hypothetical protein